MARIENLFDSGQGKLGNLVFYKMRGKGIVRTRPEHYSDRKSPAQPAQRQRMQVVNAFLKPFSDLIKLTFHPFILYPQKKRPEILFRDGCKLITYKNK